RPHSLELRGGRAVAAPRPAPRRGPRPHSSSTGASRPGAGPPPPPPIPATKPAADGVVDVLVPVALDHAYSYRVPAALALAPGDFVAVPLGPRETMGGVWGEGTARPGLDKRPKDGSEKPDIPPPQDQLPPFGRP